MDDYSGTCKDCNNLLVRLTPLCNISDPTTTDEMQCLNDSQAVCNVSAWNCTICIDVWCARMAELNDSHLHKDTSAVLSHSYLKYSHLSVFSLHLAAAITLQLHLPPDEPLSDSIHDYRGEISQYGKLVNTGEYICFSNGGHVSARCQYSTSVILTYTVAKYFIQ